MFSTANPELKSCPFCGSERICKSISTTQVKLWCARCGARMTRGGGKQYASIGNCKRYVEPIAVEAWNRRVNDEITR